MPAPNRQITARLTFRKGTALEWAASNPILLAGELALDTDANGFKMGDGTTAWDALDFYRADTIIHDQSVLDTLPSETTMLDAMYWLKAYTDTLVDALALRVTAIETTPDGDHEAEHIYLSTDILTENGDYLTAENGTLLQIEE